MKTVGLIVNPVAGMGGRVGLKGTDGVVDEAVKRGAVPVAPGKATLMLRSLREARDVYGATFHLKWKTAGALMGEQELLDAGWALGEFEVIYRPPEQCSSTDTKAACEALMGLKTDLILFCGGDGTARDIFETVGVAIPILGIPSGVKMHSGVFGVNPVIVSEIIQEFLDGRIGDGLFGGIISNRFQCLDSKIRSNVTWAGVDNPCKFRAKDSHPAKVAVVSQDHAV